MFFLILIGIAVAQKDRELSPLCNRPFPDNRAPIVVHPTDCSKFLECHYDGYFVEKQCGGPERTKYDPRLLACVDKEEGEEC